MNRHVTKSAGDLSEAVVREVLRIVTNLFVMRLS